MTLFQRYDCWLQRYTINLMLLQITLEAFSQFV